MGRASAKLIVPMLLTIKDAAAIPPWVPPDGYTLRGYEPSDQDKWAKLLILCGPGRIWSAEKLTRCLSAAECKESARLILDDNQMLVASAFATPKESEVAALCGVAVHPKHRRRGLGFGICAVVIAFLVEHGYSYIQASTGRVNLPARRLYEKLGFKYDN